MVPVPVIVPVIVPVVGVLLVAVVVGYALYLVAVLVVTGDADLGLLQLVLDVIIFLLLVEHSF